VVARKKPVFGMISLVLMVGLILTGVLLTVYEPDPLLVASDESLAVVIGTAANIIATLLAIAAVSLSSIILGMVGLIRKEPPWPAAVGLCLSVSALIVVVIAVARL
jgi:hypothetical protein